jgi:hypothetical protein
LALDLSDVPPRSVIITGTTIGPVEDYGGYVGCHIVLGLGGLLELGDGLPGVVVFPKQDVHPERKHAFRFHMWVRQSRRAS